MSQFRAPLPNLGNCLTTDNWPNSSMINSCTECVSDKNEKNFYCNGKCMSPYDLNSSCPTNALVAKNESQCKTPCVQIGSPSLSGGCSDNYDCDSNETCVLRSEPGKYKNRGFCEKNLSDVYPLADEMRDTNNQDSTSNTNVFIGVMSGLSVLILILIYRISTYK